MTRGREIVNAPGGVDGGHRKPKLVLRAAALWFATGQLAVQAGEPLVLRAIMESLGGNMRSVADGLSRRDYGQVAKAAESIAGHPQPPWFEKARILAFVGADLGKYKAHDGRTRDAATRLADAARRESGQLAADAFGELEAGCDGCHREFRKPFVDYFYGAR